MARVQILLGSQNGDKWLAGQLASIAIQRDTNWSLFVSDDGSTDQTWDILKQFQRNQGKSRVVMRPGPQSGLAANFLGLVDSASSDFEFTAFADQDDVWCPDRLSRAVAALGNPGSEIPRVYASRTWIVEANKPRRLSRRIKRTPCFGNALLQNVLAGNTLVLNRAALKILQSVDLGSGRVPFHDWWIYALLSGAGAKIIWDNQPSLYYRQHTNNYMGAHRTLRSSTKRLGGLLSCEYGSWLRQNAQALERNRSVLTAAAQDRLSQFSKALHAHPLRRGKKVLASGAFRQSHLGNLAVFGVASLGRL